MTFDVEAHPGSASHPPSYATRHSCSRTFTGRNELLLGVAEDSALRQRLLQLVNLSLGEVVVPLEIQHLQLRELLQTLHIGQWRPRTQQAA